MHHSIDETFNPGVFNVFQPKDPSPEREMEQGPSRKKAKKAKKATNRLFYNEKRQKNKHGDAKKGKKNKIYWFSYGFVAFGVLDIEET